MQILKRYTGAQNHTGIQDGSLTQSEAELIGEEGEHFISVSPCPSPALR